MAGWGAVSGVSETNLLSGVAWHLEGELWAAGWLVTLSKAQPISGLIFPSCIERKWGEHEDFLDSI